MSSMVERVAQELRNAAGMAGDGPYNLSKMDSKYLARAAIKAMRKPGIKMIVKGDMIIGSGDVDVATAGNVWGTMIDEALQSEEAKQC